MTGEMDQESHLPVHDGIRYSEALCIEAAYQRRRADRLEQRIVALEAAIKKS